MVIKDEIGLNPDVEELGDSDVTFEGFIDTRSGEYKKTWVEWASTEYSQIIAYNVISNGSSGDAVVYVVPDTFTLFITNTWIANTGLGVGNNGTTLNIYPPVSATGFKRICTCWVTTNTTGQISQTHTHPLKIPSGDRIVMNKNSNNGSVEAGFQGFLVPSKIA